jgi:hypothetical protein
MRKKDYDTLARDLRRRVALWHPADNTAGMLHEDVQARMSESMQASSLARYLADYMAVDRAAFLKACGIKP